LEKEEKHLLLPEPNLGIPINLIGPLAYYCSEKQRAQGLDPEDLALLEEHHKSDRDQEKELASWVRRPDYMTGDYTAETIFGTINSGSSGPVLKDAHMILENDAEIHIDAIEQSFRDAAEKPVHPTNPDLVAEEVYELLPDEIMWPYKLIHFVFPNDPAPNPPAVNDADYEYNMQEQADLCLRSILLPMDIGNDDVVIHYLTPHLDDMEEISDFQDKDVDERQYDFIREYSSARSNCNRARDLFLTVDDGTGVASFSPIDERADMRKRVRRRDEIYHIPTLHQARGVDPPLEGDMEKRSLALKPLRLVEAEEDDDDALIDDEDDGDRAQRDIFGDSDDDDDDEDLII